MRFLAQHRELQVGDQLPEGSRPSHDERRERSCKEECRRTVKRRRQSREQRREQQMRERAAKRERQSSRREQSSKARAFDSDSGLAPRLHLFRANL